MPHAASRLPRPLTALVCGWAMLGPCLIPNSPAIADEAGRQPAGLWQRDTITGDWGGLRSALANRGIALELNETDEVLGNPSGGVRQGTVFEGKTQVQLTLDLEKLVGLPGASIVASAYQLHGRGLTANDLDNLLTVSDVEARRATMLGDLYFEQALFNGAVNLRIGQFGADEEFLTSDVAGVFVDSSFGWPGLNGIDLPGGGPAFPFATPGVRLRYRPGSRLSIQAAVFNGDPTGRRGDPGGLEFPLDGVFAIAEAAYKTGPADGQSARGGTYKVGGWYSSLPASDLQRDTNGRSLADPAGSGIPAVHRGRYGLYAMADHALWRPPGMADGGLAGFLRVAAAPQQDRNPVYLYLDTGLTWKGPFAGRDDDIVGVAFAWANLSHSLRSLDHDTIAFTGISRPIRSAEMVLEVTYQAAITQWLTLQPDLQYIIHPGGNVPDPTYPARAIGNAVVLGLRTVLQF